MRWIQLETRTYNGLPVYEVKCPVCGHKETYHHIGKLPTQCYVCCTDLEGGEEDGESGCSNAG